MHDSAFDCIKQHKLNTMRDKQTILIQNKIQTEQQQPCEVALTVNLSVRTNFATTPYSTEHFPNENYDILIV